MLAVALVAGLMAAPCLCAAVIEGPHYVAGGLVVDVAPYGIESWAPALMARVRLLGSDRFGLSIRPQLLIDSDSLPLLPFRLPVTADARLGRTARRGWEIHLGVGMAGAPLDQYRLVPMVTGGMEVPLLQVLTVVAGASTLFEPDNVDTEVFLGAGVRFGRGH